MKLTDNPNSPLPGSDVLGTSINICSPLSGPTGSAIYNTSPDSEVANLGTTTFSVPANAGYNSIRAKNGSAKTYATREEYNSHFAASIDASTSTMGFSLDASAGFTQDINDSSYNSFGIYALNSNSYDITLTKTDTAALDSNLTSNPDYTSLPVTYDPKNPQLFFAFFNQFGTHYIDTVTLGGWLVYSTTVKNGSTYSNTDTTIQITAEYKGVLSDSSVNAQSDFQVANSAWFSDTLRKITAQGGDITILEALDPSFGSNENGPFDSWIDSMNNGEVSLLNFSISSIEKIFSGNQASAVRAALEDYKAYYISAELSQETGSVTVNGTKIASGIFDIPMPANSIGRYQVAILDEVTLELLVSLSSEIDPSGVIMTFDDALTAITPYAQTKRIIIFSLICAVQPSLLPNINKNFFPFLMDNCGAGSDPGDPLYVCLNENYPYGSASPYTTNYGLISTCNNPGTSTEAFACNQQKPLNIYAFLNPEFNDPADTTPSYTLSTMGIPPQN